MTLKQKLYNLCENYVADRIATAQNAIEAAQQSANDETKSSAGDKYETGRAMMQQEAEWGRKQLAEAWALKQSFEHVSNDQPESRVFAGSVVYTNKGIFYLSISAGKLSVDGQTVFAISVASPLGGKLLGKSTGSVVNFNEQDFTILNIA
jgi:transcription elongation GreA/GreB family factor